jgi:hypothetical protein
MVEFETAAQDRVYRKVKCHLEALLGDRLDALAEAPQFLLESQWIRTHVVVLPWGEDDAVITVRAYLAYGLERPPKLLKFLLEQNDKLRLGGLGIDSDGDIYFEHTIVGSTCNEEKLRSSALAVISAARETRDEIMHVYPGKREIDVLREL